MKCTCCFTGHRKLPADKIESIVKNLDREIENLIANGVTDFISGGALGFDQIAASLIIVKKEMGRNIRLRFALPCKNQDELWNEKQKKLYQELLLEADEITYVSEAYDDFCMKKRNSYMVQLDINPDYSDEEDPLTLKSDFILSLCELIVGGKEGLQPVEKTIIDRCTRLIYRDYLIDPAPERMPILGDLYALLRTQPEAEAQRLATSLEIYVTGSLNVFNHRTNIKADSRLICFDIKELGKGLKKIAMLVLQDAVWNRVTINRAARKNTWFYIDELHREATRCSHINFTRA